VNHNRLDPEINEYDLIVQAKQGDRQAYGQLVRRHHQGVINVVYRMCGDAAVAEDAAQEAFIRAWQHLSKFRPHSSFRNWVYRIATNAAVDMLRKERKVCDVDIDVLPLTSTQGQPEKQAIRKNRSAQVQAAVLALPPASRSALILREYEGLSYQEIADTLDIPIGTVMSRLNYARKQLRTALTPHLEDL